MSKKGLIPTQKYLLTKLPPLKRYLYLEKRIEERTRNRKGFVYYYEMDETDDYVNLVYKSPRLPSEDNIPQIEKERMKEDPDYRSIYKDDNFSNLFNYCDPYARRKREYYVKNGYHIGMGVYLTECHITPRYVQLEARIAKTDYYGYDVNARNFPLWINADLNSSCPFPQDARALFGCRLDYVFIGTNAYALFLETLARNYREIKQKYRLQCQMTVDFLKDVGREFDEKQRKTGVAELYHCDRTLVRFLWNKSRNGSIQWLRRTLDDGRPYYCGVYESTRGTKREIFIYPVDIKQDYYRTKTPYMYQIKSGVLSRFFLPGSYLGNRIFKIFYHAERGWNLTNPTSERVCKRLRRIWKPDYEHYQECIPMRFFTEELLFENPIVFLNTLYWKTMNHCIQWNHVNSDFMIDGEIQSNDFWETRFQVAEKSFHIELKRIFLADVYNSPRDPIFTEIIVNGRGRLFHLNSIPSDLIYQIFHEIFTQNINTIEELHRQEADEEDDE